ncbi:ANTAR domain-containing protein [Lentzea sp. NPDC042327]|uniref:ANTAR domain-containing protein n=1 Tax=Lentzea sp. NPDC042327 TaxID=3154801 RepID=UPI0033FD6E65
MKPHDQVDVETELKTLRDIAVHRPEIEQAKGMVRLLLSFDDETAFTVLREISQRSNIKLYDVAAIMVAVGSGGSPDRNEAVVAAVLTEVRAHGLGGPFAGAETASTDRS